MSTPPRANTGLRLEARQTQVLSMTPQLVQAIRLLQLSSLDLAVHVASEIERNPLLVEAEEALRNAREESAPAPEETERDTLGSERFETSTPDMEAGLGTELGNVFEDEGAALRGTTLRASGAAAEGLDGLEDSWRAPVTLADHLRPQIALALPHPVQGLIANRLLDRIEPDGYVREPLCDIAAQLGVPLASVRRVLSRLQTLEPAGVFARDLPECLALQLRERDRLDPAMAALLAHLDLLATRDWPALRRACGVDAEDMAEMVAEIRALDPRPGLRFAAPDPEPAEPDVLVGPGPGGAWVVTLNPAAVPRVLVDRHYHAEVRAKADPKAKAFLDTALHEAGWLLRALDQRQRTILKVATEIVRHQSAFLARGAEGLRPLSLKDVAEAIDMHESTVSRVTANKTMACPRGVVPMRAFFGAALASAHDEDGVSAGAVKARIAALVAAEPAAKPLSDAALAKALGAEGTAVARRTVAKYREALGLPSSAQRRREGRLRAG